MTEPLACKTGGTAVADGSSKECPRAVPIAGRGNGTAKFFQEASSTEGMSVSNFQVIRQAHEVRLVCVE